MKPLTDKQYMAKKGCVCPACHSQTDIVGEDINIDGNVATQECYCSECGSTWTDIYKLSGYMDLVAR